MAVKKTLLELYFTSNWFCFLCLVLILEKWFISFWWYLSLDIFIYNFNWFFISYSWILVLHIFKCFKAIIFWSKPNFSCSQSSIWSNTQLRQTFNNPIILAINWTSPFTLHTKVFWNNSFSRIVVFLGIILRSCCKLVKNQLRLKIQKILYCNFLFICLLFYVFLIILMHI